MRPWRISVFGLTTLLFLVATTSVASAHGQPIDGLESRNSYCTQTASRPYLNKENPACAQAYQGPEGDQPGYDPFESNQANGSSFSANGQLAPLIKDAVPDGQLCGAGRDKYAGFNTPTSAWPYRAYEPSTTITYRYTAWAHHPGQIDLYVSKEGFDPTTEALGWDDLESQPLSTLSTDTVNGQSAEYNSPTYEQQITLPNRTGRMIVASIWRRSDSPEVFYNCSDLVLEAGANGEIYNLGSVEGDVAPPSTNGQTSQESTATTVAEPATTSTTALTTASTTASTSTSEPQTEVAGQVVLVPGQSGDEEDHQTNTAAPSAQDASSPATGDEVAAAPLPTAESSGDGFPWTAFFLGGIFTLLLAILMVMLTVVMTGRRTDRSSLTG